jgi:hypothetical protein
MMHHCVRRIELRTPLFHELIELLSFQQFIQLLVEGMSRSRGHLRLGNPYPFLLLSLLARPHRHGRIIQTMPVNSSKLYRFTHQDLHHGLLGCCSNKAEDTVSVVVKDVKIR